MATVLVADLPEYLQTSQLVIDAKNDGIAEITCPYVIPPTTEINNTDDFEALYYACGYFQINMFDKYKQFMDKRKNIPRLVKFLLMKTAISHEFDKIYRYATYTINTHFFNCYYDYGFAGTLCACCSKLRRNFLESKNCRCIYRDECMQQLYAENKTCTRCNQPLYKELL